VPLTKEESIELKEFGGNLRRERNALEIAQERLAELVDLNIRTVRKIERGRLNILITTALRIRATSIVFEFLLDLYLVCLGSEISRSALRFRRS